MDEGSSHDRLDLPSHDGKADPKIVPPRLRIPYWKGLGADSEEKHEPVGDIDTAVVDSLKALDPNRPIREADIRIVRRNPAHWSVLRVAFPVFVRDYLRRSGPRVQIAKAAITGEYVTQMVARLECGVLAVPVHVAFSEAYDCAPGGITISSAG